MYACTTGRLAHSLTARFAPWQAGLPGTSLRSPFRRTPGVRRKHRDLAVSDQPSEDARSHAGLPDGLVRDYAGGAGLPYVVRRQSSGEIVGITRFKSLSREHRKALIGSWYAPSAWGSGCNTEGKLLLLKYGFESLGCLRIEFQVDSRNQRSAAALVRLGAVQEGTLRSYIITGDGYRRDSIVFSVLDSEWPEVKRKLELRLEEQLKLFGPRMDTDGRR